MWNLNRLEYEKFNKISARKKRLLACACLRHVLHRIPENLKHYVDEIEKLTEGKTAKLFDIVNITSWSDPIDLALYYCSSLNNTTIGLIHAAVLARDPSQPFSSQENDKYADERKWQYTLPSSQENDRYADERKWQSKLLNHMVPYGTY